MEKKVYTQKKEKVVDFLIGFLLIPFVMGASAGLAGMLNEIFAMVLSVLELVAAIYVSIKRKFIGIGFLFIAVVIPLVALGTCLVIIAGAGLWGTIFKR